MIWTPEREAEERANIKREREERCARGEHCFYHCHKTGQKLCIDCMHHEDYDPNHVEASRDMWVECSIHGE